MTIVRLVLLTMALVLAPAVTHAQEDTVTVTYRLTLTGDVPPNVLFGATAEDAESGDGAIISNKLLCGIWEKPPDDPDDYDCTRERTHTVSDEVPTGTRLMVVFYGAQSEFGVQRAMVTEDTTFSATYNFGSDDDAGSGMDEGADDGDTRTDDDADGGTDDGTDSGDAAGNDDDTAGETEGDTSGDEGVDMPETGGGGAASDGAPVGQLATGLALVGAAALTRIRIRR